MPVCTSPGRRDWAADNDVVVGTPSTTPTAPPDAAVMARSRADPQAFSAIVDRHFAAIHRYLARRIGSDRADDVAAQAFAVAFRRRGDFDASAGSARPWLYGIATNVLRNDVRSERRMLAAIARMDRTGAEDLADEVERSLARADAASELARIAGAIAALDPDQRDVLLLRAWGELSDGEIAAALGIPVGTVYSRLSRARASLQRASSDLSNSEQS
jgi:RNA polymerase sigma factor (sigma-70 family)